MFVHAALSPSVSWLPTRTGYFTYAPTEGGFEVLVTNTRLPQFPAGMDNFRHALFSVSVGVCVQRTPR